MNTARPRHRLTMLPPYTVVRRRTLTRPTVRRRPTVRHLPAGIIRRTLMAAKSFIGLAPLPTGDEEP